MHHWLRGMDAPVVTRQMFLIPMRLHHALAELSVHKSDKTQQHLSRPSVRPSAVGRASNKDSGCLSANANHKHILRTTIDHVVRQNNKTKKRQSSKKR